MWATNIQTAERLVRQAAKQGAQIILLPELFERPYFCQERQYDYYQYAQSVTENIAIQHFKSIAKELGCFTNQFLWKRWQCLV